MRAAPRRNLAGLIPWLLVVASCSTPAPSGEHLAPPPPPPPPVGATSTGIEPGPAGPATPLVLLTPLTQIARLGSAPDAIVIPGDSYTRLRIVAASGSTEANASTDPVIYPYDRRSPIARFLVGVRHGLTLTAKVSAGEFTATVPLLTVTHDSTRGGEAFTRIVRHEASDFPLFLVRGNATSDAASVTFELKGDDQVDSSVAGTALSALLQTTKLLAAPPALLTSLTTDSGKATATAIDAAIGKLFAVSLSEQQVVDGSVRSWRPLRLTVSLPRRMGHWNDRRRPPRSGEATVLGDLDYVPVGSWTVSFEPPRLSAFSSRTLPCPPIQAAAPGSPSTAASCDAGNAIAAAVGAELAGHGDDILNFKLTGGGVTGTLGAYLRQQDWWTPTLTALDGDRAKADGLCRSIRNAVSALGFSAFDGQRIIEAVAASSLVSREQGAAIGAAAGCQARPAA